MNDIVKRLRERRVTRWVHNTGETPHAEGYSTDAECQDAADEIERLRAALTTACERMDRARGILTGENPRPECNWGMLDTSDLTPNV